LGACLLSSAFCNSFQFPYPLPLKKHSITITVSTSLLPSITSLSHGDTHAVTQEIGQEQFGSQSFSVKSLCIELRSS
jgi:hypothetical protein